MRALRVREILEAGALHCALCPAPVEREGMKKHTTIDRIGWTAPTNRLMTVGGRAIGI
jgi:hypothetical protein